MREKEDGREPVSTKSYENEKLSLLRGKVRLRALLEGLLCLIGSLIYSEFPTSVLITQGSVLLLFRAMSYFCSH